MKLIQLAILKENAKMSVRNFYIQFDEVFTMLAIEITLLTTNQSITIVSNVRVLRTQTEACNVRFFFL